MASVAIFGGAGSGAIVANSVRALAATGQDIKVAGFLNDVIPKGTFISGAPVLGPFASWKTLSDDVQFLAPLHKVKAMRERVALVEALGIPAHRWGTIIDPRSSVAADAVIGRGSFVAPFASIEPGTKLGMHVIVRAGACISHDCTIGNSVYVGMNAVICGYCSVADGAYVSPSAAVRDYVRIGAYSVVGLGAVVTKDIQDSKVVVGVPARELAKPAEAPQEDA